MKLLALDTATMTASVALTAEGKVLAFRDSEVSTHSERILLIVDQALAEAGLSLADLDAIACGAGPGSFTGLRIGLSTAKGLCFSLGLPLVVVSSLAALALSAAEAARGALILACLDARRREVYAGLFELRERTVLAAAPEVVLPPARLAAYVEEAARGRPVVALGDGARLYRDQVVPFARVLDGELRATPSAARVAELAAARLETGTSDDLAAAVPSYIRPSEAEIKFPKGNLQRK